MPSFDVVSELQVLRLSTQFKIPKKKLPTALILKAAISVFN